MVPLTLERWTMIRAVDALSMFESIVPITFIAIAIVVIDFTLAVGKAILPITLIAVAIVALDLAFTVGLTIEVAAAIILVAIFISPLPADESIDESSFDHCQIWKNQASLSMRPVILPVTFIEA